MRVYKDTAYGQDIDGNRGTTIYEIELDDSDKPYILEELYKYFVDGEYEKEVTIFLYSEKLDREVEFDVEIEDYLEDLLEMYKNDQDIPEDSDKILYIEEIENILNEKNDLKWH